MDRRPRSRQSDLEVSKDLRVGVIGLGFGANHARILQAMPDVCLAAVADLDTERLAAFAGTPVTTYADYVAMLTAERLDAAVIAVPASLHLEVALAALDVRCALLVEKPLAACYEDAKLMLITAQDKGVILMPGHIERFNPAVVELFRRVQSGAIGRVLKATARRMSTSRARQHGRRQPPSDVNIVHDSAIHDIDVVRKLFGVEVASVFAVAQTGVVTPLEDAINATLSFRTPDDGSPFPVATLDVNWLSPRRVRDLTVIGEHGTFVVDYEAQALTLYRPPRGAPEEIAVQHSDQLEMELQAFVAAVSGGKPLDVTAQDGAIAVAIADAVTRSARLGRPVPLESALS